MRVACLGGGPAGLYFAILMKLRDPACEVHVFERNRAGDTFGWGVVFSDQTLENLQAADPVSERTIAGSFAHWDDIEVTVEGRTISSGGHGFIGIGRRHLLQILQARAAELKVRLHFEQECSADLSQYADFDLIVAADGVNSLFRTAHKGRFGPQIEQRRNKFIWLGTHRLFDAFSFIFERTHAGWIWAHAYRFSEDTSTFIVECSAPTWTGLGFDGMDRNACIASLERIFAAHLDGEGLMSNAAHLQGPEAWISFNRVHCERWSFDNVVLLGDAAHTAHFSIGSGTKLALEDAIKLAEVVGKPGLDGREALRSALQEYEEERRLAVLRIQNAARNSTEWFEELDRTIQFPLEQFTYSLLTRSQRVSHENLRLRDPAWLEEMERWLRRQADPGGDDEGRPVFTPFHLHEQTLVNRFVMAPMLTYQAGVDGMVGDFHLVHYSARALGGAGLLISEMVAVEPEGRATPACPGLWDDGQVAGWAKINAFVHRNSAALTCAQLGHAGGRAACRVPENGRGYDEPLTEPWPIISAFPHAWRAGGLVPAEATQADLDRVTAAFAAAARRADQAGFDMVEVQAGHGFLLSSFITPLMNRRQDDYGGPLDNRMRFPLRIVEAVRAAWPKDKALLVRISATDWSGAYGIEAADAVEIARRFQAAGADMIDVSTGETNPAARPIYGRMFQTPYAERIRNEAHVPVIAVGNITNADQANGIIAAGRADLVAFGRPLLANPALPLHEAAKADERRQFIPAPYHAGHEQLRRAGQKAAQSLRA